MTDKPQEPPQDRSVTEPNPWPPHQPAAKPARRGLRDLGTVLLTLAIIAGFAYWTLSACGQF